MIESPNRYSTSVAAGVVIGLAEIVAHDLHVPVGCGADDLGEVDPCRPAPAFAIHRQRVGSGGERLDRGSTPIFSEISMAGRNRSTAWPPVLRNVGARSTTVASNPYRVSQ